MFIGFLIKDLENFDTDQIARNQEIHKWRDIPVGGVVFAWPRLQLGYDSSKIARNASAYCKRHPSVKFVTKHKLLKNGMGFFIWRIS